MTIRVFIRKHRSDIDDTIRSENGGETIGRLNDADREDFIANIESLYLWAIREGVNV